jgi:hypothetical protein
MNVKAFIERTERRKGEDTTRRSNNCTSKPKPPRTDLFLDRIPSLYSTESSSSSSACDDILPSAAAKVVAYAVAWKEEEKRDATATTHGPLDHYQQLLPDIFDSLSTAMTRSWEYSTATAATCPVTPSSNSPYSDLSRAFDKGELLSYMVDYLSLATTSSIIIPEKSSWNRNWTGHLPLDPMPAWPTERPRNLFLNKKRYCASSSFGATTTPLTTTPLTTTQYLFPVHLSLSVCLFL